MPLALQKLLVDKPEVKKWMIVHLHMKDLQDGAPAVRPLPSPPVHLSKSLEENLRGSFNNPEAADAKVQIEEQDIHLHRWVVAKGSEVLAKRWKPEWNASGTSLDSFLGCDSCGIQPSHTSALMFFQFFYTGAVTWSETDSDTASARELLVMASVCQVPHVLCEAETKLSRVMSLKNCCELLQLADHHDAQQLRKYCLHFIASMPDSVRDTEGYGCLSQELVGEVERKRSAQKLL